MLMVDRKHHQHEGNRTLKKTTVIMAVSGALTLSVIGGAAVAIPRLTAGESQGSGFGGPGGYAAHDSAASGPGQNGNQDGSRGQQTRISEALAQLVEDGTLTQEQADAVAEALSGMDQMGGPGGPPGQAGSGQEGSGQAGSGPGSAGSGGGASFGGVPGSSDAPAAPDDSAQSGTSPTSLPNLSTT